MDYKEIHQECYEELTEDLGREPTWQEISSEYRDRIASMADAICDYYKYNES